MLMFEIVFSLVFLLVVVCAFVDVHILHKKNHQEIEKLSILVDEYAKIVTEYCEYMKSLTQIKE